MSLRPARSPVQEAAIRVADDEVPVPIWDWPVRVVHWAMVVLLAVSLTTGLVGGDWLAWHLRSGFAILALTLFRVLWGFVGSTHARFASFLRGPRRAVAYVRSLVHPPHETCAGHNPLGGWFVVLLLAALLAQADAGLFADDGISTAGPLAKHVSDAMSDRLTSLHVRGAWVLVALVAVHVGAAVGYLIVLRDNLILPMFTGTKRLPRRLAGTVSRPVAHLRALVLLAVCALAAWAIA